MMRSFIRISQQQRNLSLCSILNKNKGSTASFSTSNTSTSSNSSSNSSTSSSPSIDFGFTQVAVEDKEKLVRQVFSSVAHNYDIMNDLMSFGTHRLWKDEFVSMMGLTASAISDPNYIPKHLDVAGGTGDISFRSIKTMEKAYKNKFYENDEKHVIVCDINPDMLAVGKDRAISQVGAECAKRMEFVEGNAERLPFEDNSFDVYTIAFGLRNVTDRSAAIREAHRVLKKGGRMMIMEFSHVTHPVFATIYDTFSFNVIPKIGGIVANDEASYKYLVESIRKFPKQDELLQMMQKENFKCCTYVNLNFGAVAIHTGFKL